MKFIKQSAKDALARLGFEIKRINPRSNAAFQLQSGLSHFGITTVFDVGANTGQFATEIRRMGFCGHIVSFEPISNAFNVLSTRSETDSNWTVHPRSAVGAETGNITINIAGNSVSSSVLPMLDTHSDAAADSAYVGSEIVPVICLDDVTKAYLGPEDRSFVKIDTQGYEWHVMDGAQNTLAQATGVLCELSLVPLYEGQRLWRDVLRRLESMGFTLWAIQKGFTDPKSGRTLQMDAIFFRVGDVEN